MYALSVEDNLPLQGTPESKLFINVQIPFQWEKENQKKDVGLKLELNLCDKDGSV